MRNTNRTHGARWLAKLLGLGMILVGVAAVMTALMLLITLPIWWGDGPSLPIPVQVDISPDSGLLPLDSDSLFTGSRMNRLRGDLMVHFSNPWAQTLFLWFALLQFVLLFLIIFFLGDIVGSISSGEAFSAANAKRLRWVGMLFIIEAIFGPGASALIAKVALHGIEFTGGELSVDWFMDFASGGFFTGGVILILSEVFRQGADMKREQSLTI
jgi:hypothetical protein